MYRSDIAPYIIFKCDVSLPVEVQDILLFFLNATGRACVTEIIFITELFCYQKNLIISSTSS